MCSFIVALVASRVFNVRAANSRKQAAAQLGKQVAVQAGAALVVALGVWCAIAWVAGMEMPFAPSVGFLWLATWFVMLLFVGLFNLALPLGVLGVVATLGLGNMTGVLPYEALPSFWQDWVFAWAPQRFIGEGIRSVMYMGGSVWNASTEALAITALVGLAVSVFAICLPKRRAA